MPIKRASLLVLLAGLTGCGTGNPTASSPVTTTQNVTGNWQIESGGSGSTSLGVLLLGDLVSSGANVSGTFRFSDLAQGNGCGALNQVVTVTGTVDATNPVAQVLTLTSSTFSGSVLTAQLVLPSLLQGFGTGTIQVKGTACTFASSAAIGALFPPVNGNFGGTLAPASGTTGPSGAATLTLAQATAPSADGQYAVTGSIQFAAGACATSTAITGTASGVGIMVASAPSLASTVSIFATQPSPGMALNLNTNLLLLSTACPTLTGAQYTGTLTKQ